VTLLAISSRRISNARHGEYFLVMVDDVSYSRTTVQEKKGTKRRLRSTSSLLDLNLSTDASSIRIKIFLLGDNKVGKTSLISKYLDDDTFTVSFTSFMLVETDTWILLNNRLMLQMYKNEFTSDDKMYTLQLWNVKGKR